MKLLTCIKCSDVFSLTLKEKSCGCGAVKGRYVTNLQAEYSGEAVVVGFNNFSFIDAIREQRAHGDKSDGRGRLFEAFIIPDQTRSVRKMG